MEIGSGFLLNESEKMKKCVSLRCVSLVEISVLWISVVCSGDLWLKTLDVFKEDPNIFGYFGKRNGKFSVTSFAFVACIDWSMEKNTKHNIRLIISYCNQSVFFLSIKYANILPSLSKCDSSDSYSNCDFPILERSDSFRHCSVFWVTSSSAKIKKKKNKLK